MLCLHARPENPLDNYWISTWNVNYYPIQNCCAWRGVSAGADLRWSRGAQVETRDALAPSFRSQWESGSKVRMFQRLQGIRTFKPISLRKLKTICCARTHFSLSSIRQNDSINTPSHTHSRRNRRQQHKLIVLSFLSLCLLPAQQIGLHDGLRKGNCARNDEHTRAEDHLHSFGFPSSWPKSCLDYLHE